MRRLKVIPFLLALFMAACASPNENGGTTNNNSQQTNSNASAGDGQPNGAAQNGQPSQPLPVAKSTDIAASPEAKAGQPAPTGPAPKLDVATREIDFGNQKREKTINHTIRIKNTGQADLNIESVVPG